MKNVKMINENLHQTKNMLASLDFILSEKNRITKYRLNLTTDDIKDIIMKLKTEDYCSGPEMDYDISRNDGYIWVYKKKVMNELIYIKFKISESRGKLIIISFHIDNL